MALVSNQLFTGQGGATAFGQGGVQAIGSVLYTDYLLPFELASVLLLVGMIERSGAGAASPDNHRRAGRGTLAATPLP